MNIEPVNTDFNDNGFDRQARQLHAMALGSLSPQTLAKLRSARHAAAQPARARHAWRWVAATAFSALFAVAIGVQFLPHRPAPGLPAGVPLATAPDDAAPDYIAPLEENPDLYVWLASAEAPMLAQE